MKARELLQYCGDFGRYQKILLAQFCLINLLTTWSFYVQVIIGNVPNFVYLITKRAIIILCIFQMLCFILVGVTFHKSKVKQNLKRWKY